MRQPRLFVRTTSDGGSVSRVRPIRRQRRPPSVLYAARCAQLLARGHTAASRIRSVCVSATLKSTVNSKLCKILQCKSKSRTSRHENRTLSAYHLYIIQQHCTCKTLLLLLRSPYANKGRLVFTVSCHFSDISQIIKLPILHVHLIAIKSLKYKGYFKNFIRHSFDNNFCFGIFHHISKHSVDR